MPSPDNNHTVRVATYTICAVVLAMVATMMIALFNPIVDNAEVFKIVGPAFQTVIGALVGYVVAKIEQSSPRSEKKEKE